MWSSTCQQKEEKAMPTYTQGTVTPAQGVGGCVVAVGGCLWWLVGSCVVAGG